MNRVLDTERKLNKMEELGQILCLSVPAELLCEAMDSTQDRTEPRGRHNSNPRNSRLAQVGDAVLDLIVVEILYNKGLSKGKIEPCKQKLVCNKTQHKLLSDLWKLTPFFFNDQGFLDDPDIDKPLSASGHIPYLEAVIGVTYLHNGFEYTKRWVTEVVYPGLVKAAGL